jgi:uncharacterized SAM-binding protein YcdF (DUF218 family)
VLLALEQGSINIVMSVKRLSRSICFGLLGSIFVIPSFVWLFLFLKGKRFARRDRLHKADAIVVLAGTRGNIQFLDGKIRTAVHLYQRGWAPLIICSGRFSVKVTQTPRLIPLEELQRAVEQGRIQQKDVAGAAQKWDSGLGASYMRDQAMRLGVPPEAILVEERSLHTRENAEYTLTLLNELHLRSIILVTSPFHQLRTYLTFAKVFQSYGIEIINYYAETGEWHPATWFLSSEHRHLVKGETERIRHYRDKGDLL